jgi:hypothetical protein
MLSEIQARVLGCLIEKKETTPEQYPLTTNSLRLACNQKTARNPVSNYSEGEVGHAVRDLISMGLVREAWGARVAKYEHEAGKTLGVHSKALALLCTLILRGPQTLGELKSHSQRLFEFEDLDDVKYVLQRLAEREPPLTLTLPRQPGQKEERYAHMLCGEPSLPATPQPVRPPPASHALEERVRALEAAVEELKSRLDRLDPGSAARPEQED